MKYIYPDYFEDFRCIAGKCSHSCCIGWEIDIDADSMKRFSAVGGSIGEKLRKNISGGGDAHFILDGGERCPFLNRDGLCELILELGEDSLCDICAEHPRFYNELPGRVEYGVGMCCEEAARLLVSGREPVRLVCGDDGSDAETETPLTVLRDEILSRLNGSGGFMERMEDILLLVGKKPFHFSPDRVAEFYLTLERMDESWTGLLEEMKKHSSAPEIGKRLEDVKYTRIAHYFIFRHLVSAENTAEAAQLLVFSLLSTMTVCFLDSLGHSEDALRLYSAEIEYSDENLALITKAIETGILV